MAPYSSRSSSADLKVPSSPTACAHGTEAAPGNVAGALRALLLVAGHRDQLARELLRRAHVDELVSLSSAAEDLVALGADGVVARLGGERRGS